jgi:hypothetical protein
MTAFLLLSTIVIWAMAATVAGWLACVFPAVFRKAFVWAAPVCVTSFILFGIAYTRAHYQGAAHVLYYAAYILFGFLFLAFCTTLFFTALYFLMKFLHPPFLHFIGSASVAVMLIVFILSLWGGFSSPKVKRIPLQIDGMPSIKIAVLSDAHLGMGVSFARFDKAMERLEAEKPDVLLAVGDIFEYGPHREQYAARIKQVQTPLGTYGVLGNHEYYVGYGDSKDFYRDAGITLLENTSAVLPNGVQVAGVKDIHTVRVLPAEVTALVGGLAQDKPIILLSHTPLYAEEASKAGADLMLSGHTHNGQLYPFNYLVRLQFPRVYGLFKVGGMPFYITSGLFYWGIPLRFLAPAEIPIIEVN